jgi:predicted metal-dependent enzyme (double-stranded beta helix superfamily)
MHRDSLATFIQRVRNDWGPLSSELVERTQSHAHVLLGASSEEPWLARLLSERPANQELHRDPDHGFVLLAHAEQAGLYRAPHDHGRSWVLYAVLRGEIEMRTYARIEDPVADPRLVRRDSTPVRAGDVQLYLPGDIHDTRCLSDWALLLRFTERDLRVEDRIEGRLTRYVEKAGNWIPANR